jgi:hypothetical protein
MEIYSIILTVLAIVGYFLSYYFSVKAKIYEATESAVNEAEQDGKTSSEKMEFAVNQIYELVPAAFKPFITKAVIEKIVQKAFDKIEEYAKKQVEKRKGDESENLSKGN